MLHERNWRVSLCVRELCHPLDFLWFLAATLGCRNTTGLPALSRGFRFYLVLDFWLAWATTGLPVVSLQDVNLTQALDGNLSPSDLPLSWVSLSLNTVVVGEVDELEEDVGWLPSCLEGVIDVEEWELDEELADKPGTTIGTKFSVLHCIRIPFSMRCGFWPLIISVFIAKLSER